MRRIDYPGWRMVWALALTETVSYGVLNIARPDLLARYSARRLFARLSGIQALLVVVGEAAGPAAAAALHAVTGSYTPVFIAVGVASACSAALLVAAERACCPETLPRWPHFSWPAIRRIVSWPPARQRLDIRSGGGRQARRQAINTIG